MPYSTPAHGINNLTLQGSSSQAIFEHICNYTNAFSFCQLPHNFGDLNCVYDYLVLYILILILRKKERLTNVATHTMQMFRIRI